MEFYEEHQDQVWLWSPWHRVEVFNTIRQLTRHPERRRRLLLAEAKALIHRIESDVAVGYFTHIEADWRDVLRVATEISISNAFDRSCLAPDLLHDAYATESAAKLFVSFDADQVLLATGSGLKSVNPAKR